MSCSYCDKKALFKCKDLKPYMCQAHFGEHCATKDRYEVKNLDRPLGELKLEDIRKNKYSEILKQEKFSKSDKIIINQINEIEIFLEKFELEVASNEIEKDFPKELIFRNWKIFIVRNKDPEETKEDEEKENLEGKLEKRIKDEFERKWNEEESKRREENEFEKKEEELEKRVRKAAELERKFNEEIKKKEEEFKVQSKKVLTCEEKFICTSQSMKLKYLNSYLEWTSNFDDCFDNIEDIIISNDEKYLFVYTTMMYSDKWLEIWNLSTKKLEGEWWTSCKHSGNNKKNEKQELRRWITKYPACILNTWVYSMLN